MTDPALENRILVRNARYAVELEDYLRTLLIDEYEDRAAHSWNRDYSSIEAYLQSIEPMRVAWRGLLKPPDVAATGPLEQEPFDLPGVTNATWLSLALSGSLRAEGMLALPSAGSGPYPLIIAQHGLGSSPERVFGLTDDVGIYHGFGEALLEAGYAVLAPFNLSWTDKRNRVQRLAYLGDLTLSGIEFARLQRLLDAVLAMPQIDPQRVGMWGISLGGLATQIFTPLELRIKAAISTAWFNHRTKKLAMPDPRYSCFLDTTESYMFLPGWLTAFADEDLLSLVCPRPLLVQSGKADGIAWWPMIMETFEKLRDHYRRLGIEDRLAIDLHEGGHEIRIDSGLQWMKRFLNG